MLTLVCAARLNKPSFRLAIKQKQHLMFFTCGWSERMPVSKTPILTPAPRKPASHSFSAWKAPYMAMHGNVSMSLETLKLCCCRHPCSEDGEQKCSSL